MRYLFAYLSIVVASPLAGIGLMIIVLSATKRGSLVIMPKRGALLVVSHTSQTHMLDLMSLALAGMVRGIGASCTAWVLYLLIVGQSVWQTVVVGVFPLIAWDLWRLHTVGGGLAHPAIAEQWPSPSDANTVGRLIKRASQLSLAATAIGAFLSALFVRYR